MRLERTRRYVLLKNAVKRALPGYRPWPAPVDDDGAVEPAPPLLMDWPDGVRKPRVGLVPDVDPHPFWTKYRRFLRDNDIPWGLYDIHRSSWLRDARDFDIVVWRPMSFPYEVEEIRRKYFVLEQELGKICYPGFAEAMLYEDKLLQYELLTSRGLPMIETFVSHSLEESLDYVARCSYPQVSKVATGSGSLGVELLADRRSAERLVRRVFSFSGRATYWPYQGQKNYVYLQRLEPNRGWDLRVIVAGERVFGYYRDVPRGEFRASGMDTVRWGGLPAEALLAGRRAAQAVGFPIVAVDMLVAPDDGRISIIELSSFAQARTPRQLRVDDVPGAYVFSSEDTWEFVPCRIWTQELALELVIENRWLREGGDKAARP